MSNYFISRWIDIIITAIAPIIWGSTYIVTTQYLPPDRPFTSALIRVLPAGILLLLLTRNIPKKVDWFRLLVLGALNIGFFQAFLFIAAYRLPGGLAAVLGAIQPLVVMLITWVVDGKSPIQTALWSATAGVIGMAILLLSPQTTFEPIGIIAALMGAICMACGVWLSSHWKLDLPLLPLTGWQLLIGGLILIPMAFMVDTPLTILKPSELVAYTYLSLAGALLAYVLWFRGIKKLPTVAVASLGLLSPITAVVLGWIFLSEKISGSALFGLIIVLTSVFIVQKTSTKLN
ncbi:EamA family transporter [Acinetobacter sp. AM]|uniref:EamA family transporter n=1 Tax=Acinetobacter sp. AM TaxID=2170730 RepID=UPI000DE6428E|nr:EamA family transporter [Acinetobacter sp. AM]PWB12999.1 EamA family transporter [Acinetobacter sp. AM]